MDPNHSLVGSEATDSQGRIRENYIHERWGDAGQQQDYITERERERERERE
jgi:hypothetical protein